MALNLMQQHQAPPQQTEYYSGQWTKEEQEYVACLVDGFKHGTLDIPDGTSLRFFIAAKLGCKPKRVSKKYERSGYNGKQVYRRDTNVAPKDLEAYRQRLKNCEKAFKESRALVVSMQEAKTDSKPSNTVTETPVISLHSSTNGSALEDRLVAMRNQIDRRTTNMLGYPTTTSQHPAAAAAAAAAARYNMMGAAGAGGPLNPAAAGSMSPEVLQAMMMQRQRAAALGGFSTGFPSSSAATTGFSSGLPTAGPTNKLLIDLYQRRQQLIMSYMAAGAGNPAVAGTGAAAAATAGMVPALSSRTSPLSSPHLGPALAAGDKRDLEDLEGEEQARKRARAA